MARFATHMHLKTYLFCFIVWCVAVFYTAAPLWASEVYTIRDVTANKKSEDANMARQLAFDEAQSVGFKKLMRTLVAPEDFTSATDASPDAIAKMVESFGVEDERIEGKSYKARFNFTFRADNVKAYLVEKNITFTENISPTLLVIPIYQEGERIVLWESPNPWRDAWTNASGKSVAVPFIVPLGDLQDIASVSVEDAFAGDYTVLQQLGLKYGSSRMVIAEIILDKNIVTQLYSANVILRVLLKGEIVDRKKAYFQDLKGTPDAFMPGIVKEVISKLETNWRQTQRDQAVVQAAEAMDKVLNIAIPIANMQEWVLLKKQLEKVDLISAFEVNQMSIHDVFATVHYKGDLSAFKYMLEEKGLLLQEATDGRYLLTRK